jgi:chitin disaccharide deacetylase
MLQTMANSLPPGVIINADDLGIHPSINAGILSAYRNGILTSCTMLVTTAFLDETLREFVRPSALPIGIHLSLTLGKAVAPERAVPDLIDKEGNLRLSARELLLASFAGPGGAKLLSQIGREFEAQLSRAHDGGLRPTHADSHQHVHMNPAIFAILESLLPRFGIDRVRFSRESLSWSVLGRGFPSAIRRLNPAKWAILRARARSITPRLSVNDEFFGVMSSGLMSKPAYQSIVSGISWRRAVEISLHPGFPVPQGTKVYPSAAYNRFIASPARQLEHDLLVDPEAADSLRSRGLTLRSYDGSPKYD